MCSQRCLHITLSGRQQTSDLQVAQGISGDLQAQSIQQQVRNAAKRNSKTRTMGRSPPQYTERRLNLWDWVVEANLIDEGHADGVQGLDGVGKTAELGVEGIEHVQLCLLLSRQLARRLLHQHQRCQVDASPRL